jgi:hypothetical protein
VSTHQHTEQAPARPEEPAVDEFELEYLFDDAGAPSEVTVFAPEDGRVTTEWVTVPEWLAVPVEETR